MGHFRGEIKLQTSQGKKREKLYGKWARPLPCSLFSAAGSGTGTEESLCCGLRQKCSIRRDLRGDLAQPLAGSRISLQNHTTSQPQ